MCLVCVPQAATAQELDELCYLSAQALPSLKVSEHFQVVKLLGEGSYGKVMLAVHRKRGERKDLGVKGHGRFDAHPHSLQCESSEISPAAHSAPAQVSFICGNNKCCSGPECRRNLKTDPPFDSVHLTFCTFIALMKCSGTFFGIVLL